MRRYWIEPKNIYSDTVQFGGDLFHHIFDVCRQEVGSKFEVLTGNHKAYLVEVTKIAKKSAEANIIEVREIAPLRKPHIHLAISVPRFPVMEALVEKAVEMGVHSIHPFFSDFSFVRTQSSLPNSKIDRWNKIVISATQQSGRGDLMPIEVALPFNQLMEKFNQTSNTLGLFAYEGTSAKDIKTYVQPHKLTCPDQLWIFVGSEGGFSPTEVEKFKLTGLESVTLGEQVLRVETACIALISILKYEFELMR